MLDWYSELDYINLHLHRPHLRCGPPSALRACRSDEPAIQQQMVCNQPFQGHVLTMLQQTGCSLVRGHAII